MPHPGRGMTPLGTLSKQLKKQKQLSTPYLVLSGSNDHSSLKKEIEGKFLLPNHEKYKYADKRNEEFGLTNSYDTPLGTLSKQLKKQKQLSTPYLVLSGSNDHSSLKKE
ncbi:unnamed protein product [Caenorhabditis angaria]|uniref:Uncharacterized protein n=1 Tax=Caenorhabditis angaria TaxID=860376 RepID=A0A9P1IV19_9PELO|nr:unnamed protein product [Caenorhabditis angaria]